MSGKEKTSAIHNKCACCNARMAFRQEEDRDYLLCEYCGHEQVIRMKDRPAPDPVPVRSMPDPAVLSAISQAEARAKQEKDRRTLIILWIVYAIGLITVMILNQNERSGSALSAHFMMVVLLFFFGKRKRKVLSNIMWAMGFLLLLGSMP